MLGVSRDSVKSRWDSVYAHMPLSLEREPGLDMEDSPRARKLLVWLRKHPEELRPTLFLECLAAGSPA